MGGAGRALACGDLIAEANPTFLSAESDFLMGLGELIFLAGGGTAGAFVCFLPMFRVLATSKQDSVWFIFGGELAVVCLLGVLKVTVELSDQMRENVRRRLGGV